MRTVSVCKTQGDRFLVSLEGKGGRIAWSLSKEEASRLANLLEAELQDESSNVMSDENCWGDVWGDPSR